MEWRSAKDENRSDAMGGLLSREQQAQGPCHAPIQRTGAAGRST